MAELNRRMRHAAKICWFISSPTLCIWAEWRALHKVMGNISLWRMVNYFKSKWRIKFLGGNSTNGIDNFPLGATQYYFAGRVLLHTKTFSVASLPLPTYQREDEGAHFATKIILPPLSALVLSTIMLLLCQHGSGLFWKDICILKRFIEFFWQIAFYLMISC